MDPNVRKFLEQIVSGIKTMPELAPLGVEPTMPELMEDKYTVRMYKDQYELLRQLKLAVAALISSTPVDSSEDQVIDRASEVLYEYGLRFGRTVTDEHGKERIVDYLGPIDTSIISLRCAVEKYKETHAD